MSNITNCKTVFYLSKSETNPQGGNYHYLVSINKLVKVIKNYKPQYLNAHFSYSMGLVGLLAIKLSGEKINFSVVCHGSDILAMPHPFIYKLINKYVITNANKIFSVSSQITDEILKYSINQKKIWTGQYGIGLDKISDKQSKDIDIISVRSYVPNSQIDEMLMALDHSFFHNKNIVFILPGVSNKELEYLEKRYSFIFFKEKVIHNELIELVKRSKVYISATKSDGTALSLLEAMGYGCYPIVSNIPSNREWIVDQLNGRLFQTMEDFVNSLVEVLNKDKQFFDESKKINYNIVRQRAYYNEQMKNIEEFLIDTSYIV